MKENIRGILFKALLIIAIFVLLGFFLNMDVTTRQGIDHKIYTIHIPLYFKIIDFFDRHYSYKLLVGRIAGSKEPENDKALKILEWVNKNIHPVPAGMPVIDDHVWHIIIRRYGNDEQSQDVFTTLCNYAGMEAFFFRLRKNDASRLLTVSFVKVGGNWSIFDSAKGVYFKTSDGRLATIHDIAGGNWRPEAIGHAIVSQGDLKSHYNDYFGKISGIDFEKTHKFSRANIQSPIARIIYAVKRKGRNK